MRQIRTRQESAKLGGIGTCGRELCCSSWMTEFPSVSISSARDQNLSINLQKITGQCGRLKCCLNFELEGYLDEIKIFPNTKTELKTKKDNARFLKMDIYKKKMWYTYKKDPSLSTVIPCRSPNPASVRIHFSVSPSLSLYSKHATLPLPSVIYISSLTGDLTICHGLL